MAWHSIIGQERVKQLLQRTLERGSIAHAYLFFGPQGVGKSALALEFAKALNCEKGGAEACEACRSCKQFETLQHSDVQLIFPLPTGSNEKMGDDPYERLSEDVLAIIREEVAQKARDPYHEIQVPKANFIKINSIRELKRQAAMAHVSARYKIFILFNTEMMNAEASNSLLKTLEEPLPNTILLLTTNDKDQLLPTIVSRCQQIHCEPLAEEEIVRALRERDGAEESVARLAAQLANGSYGQARRLLADDMADRQREVVDFLSHTLAQHRSSVLEMIETLSQSDRAEVQQWLEVLQVWLREALLAQATKQTREAVFYSDRLKMFLQRFPHARLENAIETTDRAIAQIDKNVYLPLVLYTLAVELYHSIAETKS